MGMGMGMYKGAQREEHWEEAGKKRREKIVENEMETDLQPTLPFQTQIIAVFHQIQQNTKAAAGGNIFKNNLKGGI